MNSDNLRNLLNSFVADLRAKRVLPIVVLLIAAAIAIPLLLSHSGKAASLQPLPPAPTVTAPSPSAAVSTGRRHEPRQNFLTGPAHNPFISHTTTVTSTTGSAKSSTPTASAPGTSTKPSGTETVSTTCPNGQQPVDDAGHELCLICKHAVVALIGSQLKCLTPGASCDARAEATYNEYGFSCVSGRLKLGSAHITTTRSATTTPESLPYSNYEVEATILQAGVSSTPTVFHNLSRDQLLPTATTAFATFLGVRTDRQTAVFVLADDTTVTGEGNCAPSATSCRFLTLIPGQAAKVTVTSSASAPELFTLRYVAVHRVRSTASVVTIDPTGAADVTDAAPYVAQLRTITYGQYTDLLSIKLGSTVPVAP